MKKYEITLNEESLKALTHELQLTTDYYDVIIDEETRQYFEYVHKFVLESVGRKLIDAYGSFTKKRLFEKHVNAFKLKLNELEVRALYYELQDSKEVILQLQSIIMEEKVKLLSN